MTVRNPAACSTCALSGTQHCVGCKNEPVTPTDRTRAVEWAVKKIAPVLFDGMGAVNSAGIRSALEGVVIQRADPEESAWLFEQIMIFARAARDARSQNASQ